MPISADLGEQLEKVVDGLVREGRYNSKSEVLREGVRLVQEREAQLHALAREREDWLRTDVARRDAEMRKSSVLGVPMEEAFDHILKVGRRT